VRKIFFLALIILNCVGFLFSQDKPRLGILPFTGGAGGDGETIANLFSIQPDIQNAFTIVPRTSAVDTIINEQKFQLSGYTDSDTIANIGRLLNADYVVSGHIRRLGRSHLVIVTIINVETFEQIAGDYHRYRNIEEIRNLLPAISRKLIAATHRNTARLPKLAIAPFYIANTGVDVQDAETLAQILAVEISNTGKYVVLPRTTTMQAALRELEFQRQGYTAEEGIKALGRATNADYVLSADVRKLGNMNLFTAQILNVEDGRQLSGSSREYRIIDDGLILMEELALLLTDPESALIRIDALNRERSRAALFGDPAKFWSLGISAGTSFSAPWVIGTVHGTIAPFKYQFLELGIDYGMISGNEDAEKYYSFYPYIHYAIFIPFEKKGGFYIGAGCGYMLGEYTFPDEVIPFGIFAYDFITGINIGNIINISYTMRTNFKTASNKLSVGISYRFRQRE